MKEYFTNNIGKKILAITLAIILWIIANFEQDIEKNIEIDIQYNDLSPELIIKNSPPEALNIRIRGSRTKLSTLKTDNYSYPISLSNVKRGISKFNIRAEQIRIPGVQILGLSPSELDIEIDDLITKTIKIKPNIGLPDIGFNVVGTPKVSPKSVKVKGPKSILSDLEFINTDEIKIEGEKTDFTIEVPLKTSSPLLTIENDNEVVKITVDIKETIIEKEFKELGISIVDTGDKTIEITGKQTVDLLFKGPYSKIKELSSEEIEISASVKGIISKTKKKHTLKLKVEYPYTADIKLEKITPDAIAIEIK
ncbi:MAG: hypothetical protein GWO07_03465 [Candidatus Dadabacteria bacterium]|nr:hypothetical protein [Candidatus Dadabacteria bacterium]NIS07824.1 hypothetical protein [Candidatus Dadabacteria bacterium]NIV42778.1 hypothetical protein [Candidatus Dadabacteria bacterium]NIX14843.1 hypothetical protein [Candidatus Dadabacteria bacterium]NIY21443.1 hypothetical protein [Candidatus Dadabacteria bacterium]